MASPELDAAMRHRRIQRQGAVIGTGLSATGRPQRLVVFLKLLVVLLFLLEIDEDGNRRGGQRRNGGENGDKHGKSIFFQIRHLQSENRVER